MLKLPSQRSFHLCDGMSRRDFIRVGGLTLGGLTLPQLLRAESAAGLSDSRKAVIMIYMVGAPPHQDMYDLKLDAPAEIRGECQPIETVVPGMSVCEHLPLHAKVADRFNLIRSISHGFANHAALSAPTRPRGIQELTKHAGGLATFLMLLPGLV